ncbi:hypothetical protein [Companilactobacillus musae]|uniref:hypothetical protein n=1 Tax=Companilactobacillus musae TaxID=1903258 RepID=UPI000E64E4CD|nr:hypothetical protein [Companilactobacillus musae]
MKIKQVLLSIVLGITLISSGTTIVSANAVSNFKSNGNDDTYLAMNKKILGSKHVTKLETMPNGYKIIGIKGYKFNNEKQYLTFMKNEYKIIKATKNYSVPGIGFAQMTEDHQFMATYKMDKINSLKISNKKLKKYPNTLLKSATSYYVDPLFQQRSRGFNLDQVKKDGPNNDNGENNNTQILMNWE